MDGKMNNFVIGFILFCVALFAFSQFLVWVLKAVTPPGYDHAQSEAIRNRAREAKRIGLISPEEYATIIENENIKFRQELAKKGQ